PVSGPSSPRFVGVIEVWLRRLPWVARMKRAMTAEGGGGGATATWCGSSESVYRRRPLRAALVRCAHKLRLPPPQGGRWGVGWVWGGGDEPGCAGVTAGGLAIAGTSTI